jgi:hypothetical protein
VRYGVVRVAEPGGRVLYIVSDVNRGAPVERGGLQHELAVAPVEKARHSDKIVNAPYPALFPSPAALFPDVPGFEASGGSGGSSSTPVPRATIMGTPSSRR